MVLVMIALILAIVASYILFPSRMSPQNNNKKRFITILIIKYADFRNRNFVLSPK